MDNRNFDYTYIRNTVWAMRTRYPFVKVRILGKSVLGREIFALEAGQPDKPKMLYSCGYRGNDCVTPPLLLSFLDRWFEAMFKRLEVSGIDVGRAIAESGIAAVPMVNPDGREIFQKGFVYGSDGMRISRLYGGDNRRFTANARGVELIDNFDVDFASRRQAARDKGIYGPGGGYAGEKPESEPEVKLLCDYCRENNFSHSIQLHQGAGTVFWRNGNDRSLSQQRSKEYAKIISVSSGYSCEAETGQYSFGGMRNWFSAQFSRPSIDITVQPMQNSRLLYESLEEMLAVGAVV